jgi:hypothetical protein
VPAGAGVPLSVALDTVATQATSAARCSAAARNGAVARSSAVWLRWRVCANGRTYGVAGGVQLRRHAASGAVDGLQSKSTSGRSCTHTPPLLFVVLQRAPAVRKHLSGTQLRKVAHGAQSGPWCAKWPLLLDCCVPMLQVTRCTIQCRELTHSPAHTALCLAKCARLQCALSCALRCA